MNYNDRCPCGARQRVILVNCQQTGCSILYGGREPHAIRMSCEMDLSANMRLFVFACIFAVCSAAADVVGRLRIRPALEAAIHVDGHLAAYPTDSGEFSVRSLTDGAYICVD